ncbi:MAG: S8 family serine peptidase [Thermoleophilia bacterium]|nr:S8 family serine peptidase [Thermoleophilia bacterium]
MLAAPAALAGLTPALERRLETLPAGGTVPVIATLHAQVDAAGYAGRTEALLRDLRRTAARTQPAVADAVDGGLRRFWLVNAVAAEVTADEVHALAADPAVADVDLDRPVRVAEAIVDAVPYPDAGDGDWGLGAIGAPQASAAHGVTGAGVRVGSIDTGVDAAHPDLAGRVVAWRDFVNGRPSPYDDNGHGTHTVGTMVGGRAGGAPVGVAPGATAVVAKAVAANGVGSGSALLAAAQWMTDPDGNPATADHPAVINNSWSAANPNDTWFRPMIRTWLALGIVPVFAAGNTGPGSGTVGSPAGYPEALAVGAVAQGDAVADFSARGPVVWQNADGQGPAAGTVLTKPDVVAPGVNIVSTVPGGYLGYSGTSMAAPHVAGVVALMRQARPSLTAQEVADTIRASAADLGPAGPDAAFGRGRLDAAAALAAVAGPVPDTRFTTPPPALTTADQVEAQVALSGGASLVRVRVDDGAWSAPVPPPLVRVALGEGRHVVEAQGITPAGGADPSPARAEVVVDRTGPALTFASRVAGGSVVLIGRAEDALAGVDPSSLVWTTDEGTTLSGPTVTWSPRTSGRHTVRLQARDLLGNAAQITRTVTVSGARRSPIRLLTARRSVSRRSGRLVVAGRLTTRARVRATLRRSAEVETAAVRRSAARTAVSAAVGAARPGTFRLAVPVRGLAPGRYVLALVATDAAGRPIGAPLVRSLRVTR